MKTKEKNRLITEKEKKLSELIESVCIFIFFFSIKIYFNPIDQYLRTKIK